MRYSLVENIFVIHNIAESHLHIVLTMVAYSCPLFARYCSFKYVDIEDKYVDLQNSYANMQQICINMPKQCIRTIKNLKK